MRMFTPGVYLQIVSESTVKPQEAIARVHPRPEIATEVKRLFFAKGRKLTT